MLAVSLSHINWLTSPYLGSWPIIFIWGLVVVGLIAYFYKQPGKLLILLCLAWLPWACWAIDLSLVNQSLLSKSLTSKLEADFCYLARQADNKIFCDLGRLLSGIARPINNNRLALLVDSGYKPYLYYYLTDKFEFVRDSSKADYLLVQGSDQLIVGYDLIKTEGVFSIWQKKL